VELDGGVIGTLDVYAGQPRDWDPSEVAALQAYAGLVASLLSAAVTAQVKGRLAGRVGLPGRRRRVTGSTSRTGGSPVLWSRG
jgi:GAF domain-containing protein